ncbi:MAG TPA: electron transfer flavoprotein subunit alpha/FixB family protein [Pyrinomonadaceae bacterium]|nr:electron transfer flavoprotein subunit alpha/FixB family protein [Pyrinomonadaceae bacterium]
MNDVVICLFGSAGFDRSAQGLLGAGRSLCAKAGGKLRAIIVGPGEAGLPDEIASVADSVIVADQAELSEYQPEICLNALTAICGELNPRAVLLGNDAYSQELAPRLAHRLKGSAVGDATEVAMHGETLRVGRQVYGGKAQAVIELKRSPAIVWLRARSFAPAPSLAAAGEISRSAIEIKPDVRTRIVERKREETGKARLEDARVIVSGGRGIGGAEAFTAELLPLADLMGAQVAASRAACDAGWVPPTWQVGQTGKKVAPDLYLAIAIAGASQHMAGISEAKNIVAINTDSDAPIFRYCRFGIVEDYRKVVPLLREKLAALQK